MFPDMTIKWVKAWAQESLRPLLVSLDHCRLMCRMSQESYQGIRKQFHIRIVSLDVNVCVIKKEKETSKNFPDVKYPLC